MKDLDALYAMLLAYTPETMAAAGAVVTLDAEGGVTVHRGLVRPEDAKAARAARATQDGKDHDASEEDGSGQDPDATPTQPSKTLSDRLVRNLSAHRTAALQAELANKPDVALAALVHRLALTVFYHGGDSLLQIVVQPQDDLQRYAPELAQGKAADAFDALRSAWRERLPANDADLFSAVSDMKRADLLALLAVCVAGTVDAVVRNEHDRRADTLAQAVKLDMSRLLAADCRRVLRPCLQGPYPGWTQGVQTLGNQPGRGLQETLDGQGSGRVRHRCQVAARYAAHRLTA